MFCTVFPMLTPLPYNQLLQLTLLKNDSRVLSFRMQKHYNSKNFKKPKK